MAENIRLRNVMDSMARFDDVAVSNVVFDECGPNYLCKVFRYWQLYKKVRASKVLGRNVLYYYGGLGFFEAVLSCVLRLNGFYVVVDFVEDGRLYNGERSIVVAFYRYINNKVMSFVSLFVDGVVVISGHLEAYLQQLVRGKCPVVKLPVSINLEKYKNFRRMRDDGVVRFFYGGSYGYKEDVCGLLAAFSRLCRIYDNVHFVLCGKPDRRSREAVDSLLAEIASEKIEDLGYVDEVQYEFLIWNCDILCVPRKNVPYALGGFPFKLGEFMATGNAVLSSDIPEVRHIFSDDSVCYYDPDDPEDLYRNMCRLVENEEMRKSIGINGRRGAMECFDSDRHIDKLKGMLESFS